ncbi:uncharacterized protein CTHT_0037240 [Thermochaetoides thermophila DSM 1495]|uniref:Uncharacterized protein n=1 Tax=Chaetomium thermophilum (strain DSM 1495 / CBS 144.50 / IMI 039719) TaxID=759272 RepID=G0S7W6_CHATD|nr:hypothetical protein CTHT_0037240 [Thermochaetoides thermophila DSM 1495]EGS21853.1 hypothetical protein CTHT_0037240 [Thermochaetoides thermophila DSM 1495]
MPGSGTQQGSVPLADNELTSSLLTFPKLYQRAPSNPSGTGHSDLAPSSATTTQAAESPATARAMEYTGAWKPSLERSHQSWSVQEFKHEVQLREAAVPEDRIAEAPSKGLPLGFSEVR